MNENTTKNNKKRGSCNRLVSARELGNELSEMLGTDNVQNAMGKAQEHIEGFFNRTKVNQYLNGFTNNGQDEQNNSLAAKDYIITCVSRDYNNDRILECLVQYYGFDERKAKLMIRSVRAEINKELAQMCANIVQHNIYKLNTISNLCIEKEDYNNAIKAIAEINRLCGLTQWNNQVNIIKNDPKGQPEEIINVTFD